MKQIDINYYLEKFITDLKTSNDIANINSYIKYESNFPKNKSSIAIDIGGTNFRIARVTFDENGIPNITNKKECHMPGAIGEEEISIEFFFDFLTKEILNYDEKNIGICFSYPCEILPNKDGKIICFSKEVKITNSEGKIIGEEINKKLVSLGKERRTISVVNDTVSCLLGTENSNMGLILGTGLNICYKDTSGYIINSECGRYKGFPTESFDFGPMTEQKVSGAYLRDLISKVPELKTEIYDRGSKMIAIEIAGIAKYMNEKARIAIEGSVYYNVSEIRDGIKYYLDQLNVDCELLDGRNKVLIGAAVASF